MSGPFRFTHEDPKSPLDRNNPRFQPAGQPVSYKTNVNRMKTKKWVQAKKNAYDGDDWGEYDEYDEYGVNDEPPPEQGAPASNRYYAQQHADTPSRSFTDPSQQPPMQQGRRNSFERGEEQRAFSSTIPQPPQGYGPPPGGMQRLPSGADSDLGHDPHQRRDFSPSAMPPPLQTRISPLPSDVASPGNTQFPPRKSSVGQLDSPSATSPRARAGSSDKPLPFIRPADIYKRVEEERERERASLDSSRPSLDSLSSRPKEEPTSPQAEGGRSLQPLETVAERKSEYMPDFNSAFDPNGKQPASTAAPHASAVSPTDAQGFRSVVDTAFTRSDDQRSIPPTPLSKDSNDTSGISPIMSRVPSAAVKARSQTEGGGTPVIAEEQGEATSVVPQSTSAVVPEAAHVPPQPSFGHTSNLSSSSLPRSGLATPTRAESPARSPVVTPKRDIAEPQAAQLALDTSNTMVGGLKGPSSEYATREADVADALKGSPNRDNSELTATQKKTQDAFLESHHADGPLEDAGSRSRSESPSKGRVQALAGKFGEQSSSRRGSTQSNMSRHSIQSWEKSQGNSRAASPTKGNTSRSGSPTKDFRPHLPGEWQSYSTAAPTPFDPMENNKELSSQNENEKFPTSLKRQLTPQIPTPDEAEVPNSTDPMAALRDAGAAIGLSLQSTTGPATTSSDVQKEERSNPSHGDVYMPRPLKLDRPLSVISSKPPTPPAKDTPGSEFPPGSTGKGPILAAPIAGGPSGEAEESDRLRDEIERSLSPVKTPESPLADRNRSSLQPAGLAADRASSILPREYDNYWADADGKRTSTQPVQEVEHGAADVPLAAVAAAAVVPSSSTTEQPVKPSLLNRFSWETSIASERSTPATQSQATLPSLVEKAPSPVAEHVANNEPSPWASGMPDPYFGPGHTVTVTKPDPITDAELEKSPTGPQSPEALASPALMSPAREQTRSPGLHVVNTAENPEAVDLPPRYSADHSPQTPVTASKEEERPATPQGHPAENAGQTPVSPIDTSKYNVAPEATPKSPTSGRPLGAREIANINSTQDRIATYNKTRDHWANADHGLETWLVSTLDANPDLATPAFPPLNRPASGTVRHKHSPSLQLLGKLGGSSSKQHGADGAPMSASAESPTASSNPFGGRASSQQMQAKGKDLLHTAGVLSGKGMTGAKGLFAKGKSRFGRDKVDK